MLCHEWVKTFRSVAVGDIVYLAEAENDDPTYRLGVVMEANPGEDGCVRTIRVQYTNPGKDPKERSPPKTTTRPIHKVAVIVQVRFVFQGDIGGNEAGPRGRKRDLNIKKEPGAAGTSGGDPAGERDKGEPGEGELQPTGRKRHGRPKRSDKPAVAGGESGENRSLPPRRVQAGLEKGQGMVQMGLKRTRGPLRMREVSLGP
jgi:hypothetical protein